MACFLTCFRVNAEINDIFIRFNFNKPPTFLIPDSLRNQILSKNAIDMEIYKKITKEYENISKYQDIVIYSTPLYFPFIWICKSIESITKHQSMLADMNEIVNTILPCTVEEYVNTWLKKLQQYPSLHPDCLCIPSDFHDITNYKNILRDKITSPKYYAITRP